MSDRTGTDGVEAGILGRGMAYVATGAGEPLVVLSGLTASNAPPTGAERTRTVQEIMPLARDRRAWWINRPPGLARGTTMADLAAETAAVLRETFDGPVDVVTMTTPDGATYPFHCAEITDGTRAIDVGSPVRFALRARFGRYEAGAVDKIG